MNIAGFLNSAALPLTVVVPLGAAFLVLVLGVFLKRAGRILAVVAPLLTTLLAVFMMLRGSRGLIWAGGWNPLVEHVSDAGKVLSFAKIGGIALCADGLSLLMLALIGVISTLVAIYALSYMKSYTH